MQTWVMWIYGMIAGTTIMRLVMLGFACYPRVTGRVSDVIDVAVAITLLVWGACAIW